MQSSPRYLLIPDSGREEISILLSLSAAQLKAVAETLRSIETLKYKGPSYRRVASVANITNEQALSVLSAVANLLVQRKRYSLNDEQLLDDLRILCKEQIVHIDNDDETKKAFLDLLSESEEGYIVDKAESLKDGFGSHVVSMRSICDVRPVFDKDKKTIRGVLIVASLGIITHDEQHKNQTTIIHLSREQLKNLRELIQETEGKMDIMSNEFRGFNILSE
jgi:hypothetical protein